MSQRLGNILGYFSAAFVAAAFAMAVAGPWGPLDSLRYLLMGAAIFYAAASVRVRECWRGASIARILESGYFPWMVTLVFGFIFVRIKLLQMEAGQISGVDFSHLDYAIWSTARGEFMQIPIIAAQPTFSDFFGNHYSPVLLFHVAARWIFDSPLSSLVVHALSLAAAIPVLHSLAAHITDRFSAAILTLVFCFCGALASTLQFDIHQESFFPLAFGMIFLGLYSHRAFLWGGAFLAFFVKEDAGVYLLPAFLLLAALVKERRPACLVLAASSAFYTWLVLKVLMPMHQPPLAGAPYYLPMWAEYGASFQEVALTMLKNPHRVAWDVISNRDLYKNLLPWGFLPFFSLYGGMALTPIVVSSTALGVQRGFGLYYGIVLVPIFFFASAHMLQKIPRRRELSLLMLALSAFVGGSYLRFPAPLPFRAELKVAAEKLALSVNEDLTFVQSGLLPFLPYQKNWRRLDSLGQLPNSGRFFLVLFAGLSQGSLAGSELELEKFLLSAGFTIAEKTGRLTRFRSPE